MLDFGRLCKHIWELHIWIPFFLIFCALFLKGYNRLMDKRNNCSGLKCDVYIVLVACMHKSIFGLGTMLHTWFNPRHPVSSAKLTWRKTPFPLFYSLLIFLPFFSFSFDGAGTGHQPNIASSTTNKTSLIHISLPAAALLFCERIMSHSAFFYTLCGTNCCEESVE